MKALDVSDIPRGALLAALYNHASVCLRMATNPQKGAEAVERMTAEEAEKYLRDMDGSRPHLATVFQALPNFVDTLKGVNIHCHITGTSLDTRKFDIYHGPNAGRYVVEVLRQDLAQ